MAELTVSESAFYYSTHARDMLFGPLTIDKGSPASSTLVYYKISDNLDDPSKVKKTPVSFCSRDYHIAWEVQQPMIEKSVRYC